MKSPNFDLTSLTVTSHATVGTEVSVTHGCTRDGRAVQPKGFLVTDQSDAGDLTKGSTPWSPTTATFVSDVASVPFTIFLIY